MYHHRISDWDNAYTNGANIAGGDRWPDAWVAPAKAYREESLARGQGEARPRLWRPAAQPLRPVSARRRRRKASSSSSMAATGCVSIRVSGRILREGAVDSGYAVAMPTYTLCPENRIAGIVAEIGAGGRKDRRHGRRANPSDRPFGRRASGCPHGLHQLAAFGAVSQPHPQRHLDLRPARSAGR